MNRSSSRSIRSSRASPSWGAAGPVLRKWTARQFGPVRSGPAAAGPKQGSVKDRTGPDRVHQSTCPRAVTVPAAEVLLPQELQPESLPRHVALVMDGNSRWAAARGLPPTDGHEHGMRALEKTLRLSRAWGIRVLTAFGFSLENWNRPKAEVDFLMALIERFINDNLADFLREGTRLRLIGDRSRLPISVQKTARDAEETTRNNSQLDLVLAISYSRRMDIVQACRKLAQKVDDKLLRPEDIDESLFADELETSSSCPDLLIRTSGELRLSNFLLWQSAYSELFFTDTLWPDFGEAQYLQALRAFQSRDRRFGTRKNNAAL